MATSAVMAQIETNIQTVENGYQGATDKWSGVGVGIEDWFDGDQSQQVLGALTSMHNNIQSWEARGRALEQQDSPSQDDLTTFCNQGTEYLKDFNDVASYSSDSNMINILANTATATGQQIVDDAADVADKIGAFAIWWGKYGTDVIWGAAILAVIWFAWPVIKVLL